MNFIILLFGDIIIFYSSLFIALSLRAGELVNYNFYSLHIIPFTWLLLAYIFISYVFGLYEIDFISNIGKLLNGAIMSVLSLMVVAVSMFYLYPVDGITPKTNLILFSIFLFGFTIAWRLLVGSVFESLKIDALLVGRMVCPPGYRVVGIIPIESDNELIFTTIANSGIKHVLIDLNHPRIKELSKGLHTLMLSGVHFINIKQVLEERSGKVDLNSINEELLLHIAHKRNVRIFLWIKRVGDIVMSFLLFLVFLVLLPFILLALYIQSLYMKDIEGGFFIKQKRLGKNRKQFTLYKFRTMTCDDDGVWHKDADNVITPVGAFLRRSRFDELPQLWNILNGDMSFIGPRPDMVNLGRALADKIPFYNARYIVRPGLTGWAQVSQPVIPQSIEESRERLAYDLFYIKHMSLFMEIRIIIKTVKVLFRKIFLVE